MSSAPKKEARKVKSSNKIGNGDEDHVRVAIRVRPFNSREKRKGAKFCVSMKNIHSCMVWNEAKQKKKKFNFDYCYWSCDNSAKYTKQSDIFSDLGHLYVDNAFAGYNSSVFAYGQTGSGKTYTMLGTAKNPGLIPRGCEEIFRRIEQDYSDNISIEIEASYLEVYMDQIFDLLSDPESDSKKKKKSSKKRQKLAIRFHPKKGPYVQGLTRHAVGDYRDIQKLMNVGLANRTVAETQMNKISSRSHCIFTLYMNQYNNDGAVTASKINLIDLAGSERVRKTGVVGQRMEELKKINKSLSALGDVISALADHAKFVPYNNSVLTTLLSESLGGNSKTIMMAAISPADDNFDESLSTLRYAERVKKIKQVAKKNKGDSKATVERELRAQIDKLKSQLQVRSSGNKDHVHQLQGYLDNTRHELRRVKMEHKEKVHEMRDTYVKMKQHLASMGLSSVDEAKKSTMAPKLINISGDPSLSGAMVFFITSESIMVGALGGVAQILLSSRNGDIKDKHAVIRAQTVKESRSQKALDTRLYVWKLLFIECDANRDKHLNKNEFDEWSKQVLQRDDFKGFSNEQFVALCRENQLAAKVGVSWDVVVNTFIHEAPTKNVDMNVAEIVGIPHKKINEQLISDLKSMIFDEHNVLTLSMTEHGTICVDFQYDKTDSDIQAFQQEIRELFESTKYGQNVQFLRPNDPYLVKMKSSGSSDEIEKLQLTIESANPSNNNIMIFVNKERIRYNPKELHHGDHILFGTRHIFQFINPLESSSFANAADEDEKKEANQQEHIQKILDEETVKHKHVNSIFDMKNLIVNRMQTNEFRIGNADITNIQKELLKQKQESVSHDATGGDASRKLVDAFMEDYQVITHKCNSANQMSLSLDKNVLFDVGTLSYFDNVLNAKHDRIIVTRTCHYSDPELQLQMKTSEFESLLKQMTYYHELAEADGENVAAETLDDDPFVPQHTETLLGEAKLKLSGRKMPKKITTLPIQTASGDQIGTMYVELTFKLLSKNETNCYDMKKMENKQVALIIGFEKIETEMELSYVTFTFCGVGKDIVAISNRHDMDMDDEKRDEAHDVTKSFVHEFEDSYQVPTIQITSAFRNYLSAPGIVFKIWAPVFDDVGQMPPIISYKIRSKKITLRIQLPDGETLDLLCKTGNKIGSIKRKIEFRTEIGDYQQKLYYNGVLLDNIRTLLDYNMSNGSDVMLKVEGANERESSDVPLYSKRTSLVDLDVSDLQKELTNPRLSAMERGKIRRLKNKSIHMAFLKDDLINPSTMTLESYQEENVKLRDELSRANKRIEQLERELAAAKSKGVGTKKTKVFGSWRRNKNK